MKKHLAVIMAAAMAFAAVPAVSASAAENDQTKDFVLFGDSIAAGYTRANNVKYNYGEILADYYNGTVSNYAVSGDDSDNMLDIISNLNDEQKKAVKDSECIVISIGGNDMIHYVCHDLIVYLASAGLLNEGYTLENIPEKPTVNELMAILPEDKLKEYASDMGNALSLLGALTTSVAGLRFDIPDSGYNCYIRTHIMKNISEAVTKLRAINPDAKIVVQNIYQPVQIEESYIKKVYNSDAYATLINQVRSNLEDTMKAFNKELAAQAEADGFIMADVLTNFTSMDPKVSKNSQNPGNAAYFVDIKQGSLRNADIHPNQKGHLAIAAAVINSLGETHNDSGILSDIYEKLGDKADYPAIALENLEAAMGTWTLGDVNFDGNVDARDATVALTAYAKMSAGKEGLKARPALAADVNKDSNVDAKDATFLLTYYAKASAGKTGSFESYINEKK